MKVQKFNQICALLIAGLIFVGIPVLSAPVEARRSTNKTGPQQDTITFVCPEILILAAQPPEGWAYQWGSKKLKFKSATVDSAGGQLECYYGESFAEALVRPIPKGHQCKDDGGRFIECKRIRAPIKIKPKGE